MSEPASHPAKKTGRETFTSNWGFLCTAACSAIGLANIGRCNWRELFLESVVLDDHLSYQHQGGALRH